ncbi:hypothetical protein CI1B_27650 [Bradyrhizobium ivorense]|uniref:DUF4325 domain-containing protein n=1 Tax=Bradyrhizobium ivorense TaxID=2511166 RepID=A0A508T3V1_9BRAD|nr:hypothetical protein [Bradyrhizobium ivorense]VIO69559.1 hypothetical protein CI1B_27650 [Bradyrhizobium ivorense]VIO71305.1 hypothetical protein CI41S_29760 [Bradyrhizobium ivorense]
MRYPYINMRELTGIDVLSSASDGRAGFKAMLEKIQTDPASPTPLVIDFAGITVATASYLREAIFNLKTFLRGSNSKFYPVVANANAVVLDELAVIADARKENLLAADVSPAGAVENQHIIGQLDPKQASTFERVTGLGRTTAGDLNRMFGEADGVTAPTVWNNRLASLAAAGLILEFTQGRAKFYQPLFTEAS